MKYVRLLALLTVLLLMAAACGGDDAEGESGEDSAGAATETTDEATDVDDVDVAEDSTEAGLPERGDADLVIWADDIRAETMQELGDQFGQEQGVTVAVQEVAFEDIRGQLQQAGPAGEGPDIILGANDWIGELVTNGAIAPVELSNPGDFQDVAIEAFTWDGQLVGVPYAVENLALFRNTDLVPEAPSTWEEVVDTSLQLQSDGEVDQAFLIPAAPEEAPYHFHPIFTGFGGYVFALQDGTYDTSDVGIDSEGGIEAAATVGEWVSEGFINPDVTGQIMQEQFGAGEAAFAVTGPWALVQGGAGFEETGVPFEVQAFPEIDGNPMQPFVGVQGFMISAFAENSLLAQSFVTETMADEEAQLALFEAGGRPPALVSAAEQVRSDNPTIAAFGDAAEEGVPLPAVPAMSTVFTSLGDAWTLVFNGDDPAQAMENAAQTVRDAVEAG